MTKTMFAMAAVAAAMAFPSIASAATLTVRNQAPIIILDNVAATPYASSIPVNGQAGVVTGVQVSLRGFTHARPRDVDILLIAPDGNRTIVMSDACESAESTDFVFESHAAAEMPRTESCDGTSYRPTNHDAPGDPFPDVQGAIDADFSAFTGAEPNGKWHLYVVDDSAGAIGKIATGWALTLETTVADLQVPKPGQFGSGKASEYPVTQTVAGLDGVIDDVDVSISGIYHKLPDDLDLLLEGPDGQTVMLMSDACGEQPLVDANLGWNEQATSAMSDDGACPDGGYLPTDRYPGDMLQAPAPAAPHANSLAVFDGTDPNGEWKLYAYDDSIGGSGFFVERFKLTFGTRPKAKVAFKEGAVELTEGGSALVTLTRTASLFEGAVGVRSTAGSATSGTDFTALLAPVAFQPGETRVTVPIDALADGVAEPPETFTLTLEGTAGDAEPAAGSTVKVTIRDPAPTSTPAPAATATPGPTATPRSGRPAVDRIAPVVSRLAVRGNSVRYRLSEAAAVTVRIQRCNGTRCRTVKTLRSKGRLGVNSMRFKRPRGGYRVTVTAVDLAGNRSSTAKRMRISPPVPVPAVVFGGGEG